MYALLPIRVMLATCLFTLAAAAPAETSLAKPSTLTTPQLKALIPQLQKGGYVFYFRHMATDMFQLDDHPTIGDCKTQRNLSDEGKAQARTIAKALQKHNIPIGLVFSSPFCRCVETAQLAFGKTTVDNSLFFATRQSAGERKANAEKLRKNMSKRPQAASNTVIVAHNANLMEAYGIWPDQEGAAYLFKPDGTSTGTAIGQILVGLWQELAN